MVRVDFVIVALEPSGAVEIAPCSTNSSKPFLHKEIYMYIYTCLYMYTYIHMYVCIHVYICMYEKIVMFSSPHNIQSTDHKEGFLFAGLLLICGGC